MSRIARWLLTLAVALIALAASVGGALAAPSGADNQPREKAALERDYKAAQRRLVEMDGRLAKADAYAARIAERIARLKAKGQDTTALDQALAAFRGSMGKARKEWEAAAEVLAKHAGFDGQGKVTDLDQARATLKDARGHMEQAHTIGREAYRALHAAFFKYRQSHREVEEPQPPEAP